MKKFTEWLSFREFYPLYIKENGAFAPFSFHCRETTGCAGGREKALARGEKKNSF